MKAAGFVVFAIFVGFRVFAVCAKSVDFERKERLKIDESDDNSFVTLVKGHEDQSNELNVVEEKNRGNCVSQCVHNADSEGKSESRALGEARKRKKKKQQDLMSRILPMMVIPFMIQTAMIPMVLTSLKFMLLKSAFIGKLAIILGLLNALRRMQNTGGVYSHNVNIGEDTKKLHQMHYGYYGAPEYGAWINR